MVPMQDTRLLDITCSIIGKIVWNIIPNTEGVEYLMTLLISTYTALYAGIIENEFRTILCRITYHAVEVLSHKPTENCEMYCRIVISYGFFTVMRCVEVSVNCLTDWACCLSVTSPATNRDPFYRYGLALTTWIGKCIHYKVRDGITYEFTNLNESAIEVCE